MKYCETSGCETEASEIRGGHNRNLHLCYTCAEAFDMGESVGYEAAKKKFSSQPKMTLVPVGFIAPDEQGG